MNESQKKKCHKIIHSASVAAAGVGAGLAQLPCADNAALIPIQVAMVISLGKVFDIDLTESAAKSTLTTAATTAVGRGVSQVLLGWIPGVGNAINATTAAGVTEAAGWVIADDFYKQWRKENEY